MTFVPQIRYFIGSAPFDTQGKETNVLWVGLSEEGAGCYSHRGGRDSDPSINVDETLKEGGRLVIQSEKIVQSFDLFYCGKNPRKKVVFPVEK